MKKVMVILGVEVLIFMALVAIGRVTFTVLPVWVGRNLYLVDPIHEAATLTLYAVFGTAAGAIGGAIGAIVRKVVIKK